MVHDARMALGKVYRIGTNLPVYSTVELDIPIEQIVPDAVAIAKREVLVEAIGIVVGAVVLGAAGLYVYHQLAR